MSGQCCCPDILFHSNMKDVGNLLYMEKKCVNTLIMFRWSSIEPVSIAECIAQIGLPTSTPVMSICEVSMLPNVEPPALSEWLTKN